MELSGILGQKDNSTSLISEASVYKFAIYVPSPRHSGCKSSDSGSLKFAGRLVPIT